MFAEAPQWQKDAFDWACWFFKMRGFDYNCMGFLLLKLDATLRYWKSIYFAGHLVILAFYIIGTVVAMMRPKKPKVYDVQEKIVQGTDKTQ